MGPDDQMGAGDVESHACRLRQLRLSTIHKPEAHYTLGVSKADEGIWISERVA